MFPGEMAGSRGKAGDTQNEPMVSCSVGKSERSDDPESLRVGESKEKWVHTGELPVSKGGIIQAKKPILYHNPKPTRKHP